MTVLNDWQVQVLRLTAFRLAPTEDLPRFWTHLTGEPPAHIDAQPRQQTIQEAGPTAFGTLVHTSTPTRIDWYLFPLEEQETAPIPTLGVFPTVSGEFLTMMSKWLGFTELPDVKRLAYGAVLLQPVDSKVAAYTKLTTFLPNVKIDVENSHDFFYQINRPRESPQNIAINRLSKWSVILTNRVGVFIEPKAEITTSSSKPAFACRLELDINTSQQYSEAIPKQQLTTILQEMYTYGNDIALKGDEQWY